MWRCGSRALFCLRYQRHRFNKFAVYISRADMYSDVNKQQILQRQTAPMSTPCTIVGDEAISLFFFCVQLVYVRSFMTWGGGFQVMGGQARWKTEKRHVYVQKKGTISRERRIGIARGSWQIYWPYFIYAFGLNLAFLGYIESFVQPLDGGTAREEHKTI